MRLDMASDRANPVERRSPIRRVAKRFYPGLAGDR